MISKQMQQLCCLKVKTISPKKFPKPNSLFQRLPSRYQNQSFNNVNAHLNFHRSSPLPNLVFTAPQLLFYNLYASSKNLYSTNVEGVYPPKKKDEIEEQKRRAKKWTSSQVQDWFIGTKILKDTMITKGFQCIDGDALLKLTFVELMKEPYSLESEEAESLIWKRLELKNENDWSQEDVFIWAKNILTTKYPSHKEEMIKQAKILEEQFVTGETLLTLTEDELVNDYKMARGSADILVKYFKLRTRGPIDQVTPTPLSNSFFKLFSKIKNFLPTFLAIKPKLNPSSVEEAIDHLGLSNIQVGKSNEKVLKNIKGINSETTYFGRSEKDIEKMAQEILSLMGKRETYQGNAYFLAGGKGQGKTRALMELLKYYRTKPDIYVPLFITFSGISPYSDEEKHDSLACRIFYSYLLYLGYDIDFSRYRNAISFDYVYNVCDILEKHVKDKAKKFIFLIDDIQQLGDRSINKYLSDLHVNRDLREKFYLVLSSPSKKDYCGVGPIRSSRIITWITLPNLNYKNTRDLLGEIIISKEGKNIYEEMEISRAELIQKILFLCGNHPRSLVLAGTFIVDNYNLIINNSDKEVLNQLRNYIFNDLFDSTIEYNDQKIVNCILAIIGCSIFGGPFVKFATQRRIWLNEGLYEGSYELVEPLFEKGIVSSVDGYGYPTFSPFFLEYHVEKLVERKILQVDILESLKYLLYESEFNISENGRKNVHAHWEVFTRQLYLKGISRKAEYVGDFRNISLKEHYLLDLSLIEIAEDIEEEYEYLKFDVDYRNLRGKMKKFRSNNFDIYCKKKNDRKFEFKDTEKLRLFNDHPANLRSKLKYLQYSNHVKLMILWQLKNIYEPL